MIFRAASTLLRGRLSFTRRSADCGGSTHRSKCASQLIQIAIDGVVSSRWAMALPRGENALLQSVPGHGA